MIADWMLFPVILVIVIAGAVVLEWWPRRRRPYCQCGYAMGWRWFWSNKANRGTGHPDRKRYWVCLRPWHDIREDRSTGQEAIFGRSLDDINKHDGWEAAYDFAGRGLDGDVER